MQSSGISSRATPSPNRFPDEPPRSRFALTGRSRPLDRRVEPARRDLADIRLADRVFAPHYALPVTCCALHASPLRAEPGAAPVSEILPGESFDVLELSRDRAWGVSTVDGCVGYVAAAALGACIASTHRVAAARAPLRAGPEPDARQIGELPMGALIAVRGTGAMLETGSGFVAAADLIAAGAFASDFVDVAEALIGTPTVPGGRSGAGVDPAGLVFLALAMAGKAGPRLLDLQAAGLGAPLAEAASLARGDLLFFAEHVAILTEPTMVVHAGRGAVVRESVEAVAAGGRYGPVVARRRLA